MRWKRVIIHHAAIPDAPGLQWEAIRRYHVVSRRWKGIGYHFGVERVGGALVWLAGRPLDSPGAHCPGRNHDSIGVCFVGDYSVVPPDQETLEFAARHIAGLLYALEIPVAEIRPHGAFRTTRCPGATFPMDKLERLVALQPSMSRSRPLAAGGL